MCELLCCTQSEDRKKNILYSSAKTYGKIALGLDIANITYTAAVATILMGGIYPRHSLNCCYHMHAFTTRYMLTIIVPTPHRSCCYAFHLEEIQQVTCAATSSKPSPSFHSIGVIAWE